MCLSAYPLRGGAVVAAPFVLGAAAGIATAGLMAAAAGGALGTGVGKSIMSRLETQNKHLNIILRLWGL